MRFVSGGIFGRNCVFAWSKTPGRFHDCGKLLITIDCRAHVLVIVTELIECDNSVSFLRLPQTHVLHVHFFWRDLAINYFRKFTHIYCLSDVLKCHFSVPSNVKLIVSSWYPRHSSRVQITLIKKKEKYKYKWFKYLLTLIAVMNSCKLIWPLPSLSKYLRRISICSGTRFNPINLRPSSNSAGSIYLLWFLSRI